MLEYGIKTITTNPTLITKSNEIIKLIDTRSNQTRAFVLPSSYAPLVEKLVKELEAKKWVKDKKALLNNSNIKEDNMSEIMTYGMACIDEYLGNF